MGNKSSKKNRVPNQATQGISAATQEISAATQEISAATQEISEATQEISAATQEISEATQEISAAAQADSAAKQLSIVRFNAASLKKTSLPKEIKGYHEFTHWGLLYEDHRGRATLMHIHRAENGGYDFESWGNFKPTHSYKDKHLVSSLSTLTKDEVEAVCYDVTDNFKFNQVSHNCQNWVSEVLDRLKLKPPISPANESCGCLYLVKLVTLSSEKIGPSDIEK